MSVGKAGPGGKEPIGGKGRPAQGKVSAGKGQKRAGSPQAKSGKSLQIRKIESTEVSPAKGLYERGCDLLKYGSREAIKGSTAFASSYTGNTFRNVGNLFYESASESLPQISQFIQEFITGEIDWDQQKDPIVHAGVDLAAAKTAQAYEDVASLADRTATSSAEKLSNLTEMGIDIGAKMAPKIVYSTASQLVVMSMVRDIMGEGMNEYELSTVAFLASEIMYNKMTTGAAEFDERLLARAAGRLFLEPLKDELTEITVHELLKANDEAAFQIIHKAVKQTLKIAYKKSPANVSQQIKRAKGKKL